jgi:hypothetical protein
MFSVCSPVFSKCSPVFSKCSPNVLQLFFNCYRYVRSMLDKTAGVHVARRTLQLANEARHSFNSNRVSIHIVSGMPLPIACNCSIALRSGTCLAAHSGMQLILCLSSSGEQLRFPIAHNLSLLGRIQVHVRAACRILANG